MNDESEKSDAVFNKDGDVRECDDGVTRDGFDRLTIGDIYKQTMVTCTSKQ